MNEYHITRLSAVVVACRAISSHLYREGIFVLVVDSNGAPQQLDAVEVVHGQNRASLVLVLDEAEALGVRQTERGGGNGGAVSNDISAIILRREQRGKSRNQDIAV